MMDYAEEAERHRRVADEFRILAECTPHRALRPFYLDAAEVYDTLADNEARVAQNLKMVN